MRYNKEMSNKVIKFVGLYSLTGIRFAILASGLAVLLCLGSAAQAQEDFKLGEILPSPQCFNIVNEAPYGVYGSLTTGKYQTPQGVIAHHRSNFRLEPGMQQQFCTTGPMYPDGKLELTLRSLVPLFTCHTGINGDVVIHGDKKPDGTIKTWADCL